jgi:hypothetical protein
MGSQAKESRRAQPARDSAAPATRGMRGRLRPVLARIRRNDRSAELSCRLSAMTEMKVAAKQPI